MTTVTDHYRRLRREDPYLSASRAIHWAREQERASAAGIPPSPDYMGGGDYPARPENGDPVTIRGHEYRVTVEVDDSISKRTDAGDCYGDLHELTERDLESNWWHPPTPEPPAIRIGREGEGSIYVYDPGEYFEYRGERGASRSVARDQVRALLEREAEPDIRARERGEWPFRIVFLYDPATENHDVLGAVDGLDNERPGGGSAYLLELLEELAYDLEDRRESAAVAELAVTAHG